MQGVVGAVYLLVILCGIAALLIRTAWAVITTPIVFVMAFCGLLTWAFYKHLEDE